MNKLLKLFTLSCFLMTTTAFANPTAVCSGPDIVEDTTGNGVATASYTARRSYDYQDQDLSNASVQWQASSSNPTKPCKVVASQNSQWDASAKFIVDDYFPVFCTITLKIVDNGVPNSCVKNVQVKPLCDFNDPTPFCN
jgi:hypothetical protein